MISRDEYDEIKEFLKNRVREINRSENADRKKNRENKTKYDLPNCDAYGWMPAITTCFGHDVGHGLVMYIIPFQSYYKCLSEYLPQTLYINQGLFGTENAKDVISALYKASGYYKMGDLSEYQQYLIDSACCYFILRDRDGEFCERVFRLDLFRHILKNENDGYDFDGGLMHAFRHCSWNDMNLSSGKGEIGLNTLWELPIMLGKAILLDKKQKNKKNETIYIHEGRKWHIVYYVDSETNVSYLITAFVNDKK